ncbi:MAG: aminotransferase class I/II-fold pyridoxal phosphate-dependent enzyme, partial [Candidatus Eremiobacteraeota bacterium]|nr:aminotransferase class I/II-fold pyridoxal phosphate-dependent enzyme [Candidatus Eremiobacteraeota bacterium]
MNPKVLEIKGSLIREVASKRRETTIDLGLGEPSLMPAARHLQHAMDYVAKRGIKYSQNAGDPELREAIAHHYRYASLDRIENVCVTTGSQEAMYVALKTLLDPATDDLLVVEPAFPSYLKMARLEGAGVQSVAMSATDDFGIDAERIVAGITPRT